MHEPTPPAPPRPNLARLVPAAMLVAVHHAAGAAAARLCRCRNARHLQAAAHTWAADMAAARRRHPAGRRRTPDPGYWTDGTESELDTLLDRRPGPESGLREPLPLANVTREQFHALGPIVQRKLHRAALDQAGQFPAEPIPEWINDLPTSPPATG